MPRRTEAAEYQQDLVENLLACNRDGIRWSVAGLYGVILRRQHVCWRVRRACKRALLQVDAFLEDQASYSRMIGCVKDTVSKSMYGPLVERCALKHLQAAQEAAGSGDKDRSLKLYNLACLLVGNDEVQVLTEEHRLSFVVQHSEAPQPTRGYSFATCC